MHNLEFTPLVANIRPKTEDRTVDPPPKERSKNVSQSWTPTRLYTNGNYEGDISMFEIADAFDDFDDFGNLNKLDDEFLDNLERIEIPVRQGPVRAALGVPQVVLSPQRAAFNSRRAASNSRHATTATPHVPLNPPRAAVSTSCTALSTSRTTLSTSCTTTSIPRTTLSTPCIPLSSSRVTLDLPSDPHHIQKQVTEVQDEVPYIVTTESDDDVSIYSHANQFSGKSKYSIKPIAGSQFSIQTLSEASSDLNPIMSARRPNCTTPQKVTRASYYSSPSNYAKIGDGHDQGKKFIWDEEDDYNNKFNVEIVEDFNSHPTEFDACADINSSPDVETSHLEASKNLPETKKEKEGFKFLQIILYYLILAFNSKLFKDFADFMLNIHKSPLIHQSYNFMCTFWDGFLAACKAVYLVITHMSNLSFFLWQCRVLMRNAARSMIWKMILAKSGDVLFFALVLIFTPFLFLVSIIGLIVALYCKFRDWRNKDIIYINQ